MTQDWFCEKCGVSGSITLPNDKAAIYDVLERLVENHRRKSVLCAGLNPRDIGGKIRVRNPELMKPKEWRKMIRQWKERKADSPAGVERRQR